jgi:predicted amidohydrolase
MKIATLQFNPQVGQIAANFSRAESLLMREEREGVLQNLDLLVLPELAFTGKLHLMQKIGQMTRFATPYRHVDLSEVWQVRNAEALSRLQSSLTCSYRPVPGTNSSRPFN